MLYISCLIICMIVFMYLRSCNYITKEFGVFFFSKYARDNFMPELLLRSVIIKL